MRTTRVVKTAQPTTSRKEPRKAGTTKPKERLITGDYSANVNEYVHILRDPVINEVSLNWLLHLRESQPSRVQTSRTDNVPSVYYKTAKAKKNTPDIDYRGNLLDILHLTQNKHGSPSLTQVAFETGLRQYKANNIHKDKFDLIPLYHKKDEPREFLPPMRPSSTQQMSRMPFLQRTKGFPVKGAKGPVKFVTSFEGPGAFPPYKDKLRDPNCNNAKHLLNGNEVRLSTALWETGLRNYPSLKHKKQ
eukprot:TRINITY_DN9710_c0_g1_i11.p1 TRINITY_DN9710_c0_g1~~TRINITY_DN9710_c0_g1_i11.p1  ORF type:complete len:247 (+),score=25.59 TRINITY_DN9710_c0_g1_i11:93-833(+)